MYFKQLGRGNLNCLTLTGIYGIIRLFTKIRRSAGDNVNAEPLAFGNSLRKSSITFYGYYPRSVNASVRVAYIVTIS